MVAGRILKCFNELYEGKNVQIDYGIASMDGEGFWDEYYRRTGKIHRRI